MSVLHICPGPEPIASTEDDRPTRWCFQCRKHLPHTWTLLEDPPERQPSYYEPIPVIRCSRCQEDHTDFPGTYPDGPHYPESEDVWRRLTAEAARVRATWDWDAIWQRDRELREAFSA